MGSLRLLAAWFSAALLAGAAEPDLAQGRAIFISNCSFCHGAKGEGGRGANLAAREYTHGRDKASIERVISKGVPGSQMPGFGDFQVDELESLVAFVQSLSQGSGGSVKPSGNAAKGESLYAKNRCGMCHRVGSEGSVYGPDLSRVGAGRSLAYIRDSIVKPSADVPNEYKGVTVVTQDDIRVSGVRVNEDTFTVQLRDIGQRFRMFDKSALKSIAESKTSLMPPYTMPAGELEDLVAYLASLRGRAESGKDAKQAEGIH